MISPPKKALQFLRWFCREDYLDEIEGDLIELFEKRSGSSLRKARQRFFWDVFRSFRPKNIKLKLNNTTMYQVKNYVKIYFRRLKMETTHYAVNILGLALGISVFLFILLYVKHEQSIDAFHEKGNRIYRVLETSRTPEEGVKHYAATANPLAGALKDEFPEIEESARMLYMGSMNVRYKDRLFQDRNYVYSSASIFSILDLNVISGDPFKAFNGPMGAMLTQSMARKLFPNEDPVGKVIQMPNKIDGGVEVLGVMQDMPDNSTYQFKMIFVTEFDRLLEIFPWLERWDSRAMTTLVVLKEGATPSQIMSKKETFLEKYFPEEIRDQHDFTFQPIDEVHLGSSHLSSFYAEPLYAITYSSHRYLYIVLLVGLFVVAIAILNYINLSSVQALKRIQEAGVRKVNGATTGQLRVQLLVETFLSVAIAYVLTFLLIFFFFNQFLGISEKPIQFSELFDSQMMGYQLVTFVSVWWISAFIPAAYYSKLNHSLGALKKNVFSGKGDGLRKMFVTVQYSISLLLIMGTLILYQQMTYVSTMSLGFDHKNVITWDINSGEARKNYTQIINSLKSNAEIVSASASSRVPGEWKSQIMVGISLEKGQEISEAAHFAVDEHWISMYDMNIVEGKNFSGRTHSDTLKVVINETAARMLDFENPVGESFYLNRNDRVARMQVIGVVEDFHYQSMHESLGPVVLTSLYNPFIGSDYYSVKYKNDPAEAISIIEETQRSFDPNTAAEINFLDQKWERYYKADQARSQLIMIATCISIVISAFGLFGLVSFSVERKTKEIGIRKTLGATAWQIISSLLKSYAVLLVVSLLIAAPLAYFTLSSWLDTFAYRIRMTPWIFLAAFLLVTLISFLTVISRVRKFAKANPVESLRYE